jgi:hypothetical protein
MDGAPGYRDVSGPSLAFQSRGMMKESPPGSANRMKELVFDVMQEADGGYTAEALGESIFTQADSWDELKANVREAVQAFYFDSVAPSSISFSQ